MTTRWNAEWTVLVGSLYPGQRHIFSSSVQIAHTPHTVQCGSRMWCLLMVQGLRTANKKQQTRSKCHGSSTPLSRDQSKDRHVSARKSHSQIVQHSNDTLHRLRHGRQVHTLSLCLSLKRPCLHAPEENAQ